MSRIRSLRLRLTVYLVVLHVGLGGIVLWLLQDRPWLFLGLEVALVVSLLVGLALSRRSSLPRELLRTGSELMREEEFGSRLAEGGDGEVTRLVSLFNGMMERLRQERLAVRERNQLLDRVIEASPAAFLTLDHDGRIDLANPAAASLFASDREDLVGREVEELPSPLGPELAELHDGESRLTSLQGRRFRLSRNLFYDRGFPRPFFLVEELTEELRATEKGAYERLIRMVSHEVKNSVGAVVSLLQSVAGLAEGLPPPEKEKASRALGVSEKRLRSLDRFVDGFADVVRIPSPERRELDPVELLDDLLLLLEPELEDRRIEARWSGRPEATAWISADKNQLEQALVNVLRNAIEATGREGEIVLSLGVEDGGLLVLEIADSGPGIPAEVRDDLFVPFLSTKRDGRGLGLTIIREILDGHGFSYSLEDRAEEPSADPGKTEASRGAVFRIGFGAVASGRPEEGRNRDSAPTETH